MMDWKGSVSFQITSRIHSALNGEPKINYKIPQDSSNLGQDSNQAYTKYKSTILSPEQPVQ
jgi:hypothetical protein